MNVSLRAGAEKRMAKQYDRITPTLQSFIKAQPLFFVATAPLPEHGHINLSPKGYDSFRILSSNQVTYLDFDRLTTNFASEPFFV